MEIRKVQGTDMMAAREARAFRQQELIRKYEKNVICFTLNIAGPVKNSDLIQKTFEEGVTCIFNQLEVSQFFFLKRYMRLREMKLLLLWIAII